MATALLSAFKLARTAHSAYQEHHRRKDARNHSTAPSIGHYDDRYPYDEPAAHKRLTMIDLSRHSSSGGLPGLLARVFLRFFQFVLALTVCGLYGVDLHHAAEKSSYADSKWVYAEVVAGLSAVTCLLYFVPLIKSVAFFFWDWTLFVLWAAVFGVFGKMYIHENAEYDGGITRMKHAVWVDLANMLLWLITAVYGTVWWFTGRKRTLHTGRSEV